MPCTWDAQSTCVPGNTAIIMQGAAGDVGPQPPASGAAVDDDDDLDRVKPLVVRRQGNPGHIKHVQVQNFMCHHNFCMDFG